MTSGPPYPVFPELLRRCDLTITDVVLYGALSVLQRPSVAELALALGQNGTPHNNRLRERIAKLEAFGLIRREFKPGGRTTYVLLGPTIPQTGWPDQKRSA